MPPLLYNSVNVDSRFLTLFMQRHCVLTVLQLSVSVIHSLKSPFPPAVYRYIIYDGQVATNCAENVAAKLGKGSLWTFLNL